MAYDPFEDPGWDGPQITPARTDAPDFVEDPDTLKVRGLLENNADKNFVHRILEPNKYPSIDNGDGTRSSHLMSWGEQDGRYIAYPNITQESDGQLLQRDGSDAFRHAIKSGEYLEFDSGEEADWFTKNYKKVWEKPAQAAPERRLEDFDPFGDEAWLGERQSAAQRLEKPNDGKMSDLVSDWGVGSGQFAKAVGWALDQVGAERAADFVNEAGDSAVEYWFDKYSEEAKHEATSDFLNVNPDGSWDVNWSKIPRMAGQALPGTVAGMGGGMVITKGLQLAANPFGRAILKNAVDRAAVTKAAAGTKHLEFYKRVAGAGADQARKKLIRVDRALGVVGAGAGEGIVGGMMGGHNTYERVMKADPQLMWENERFQEVFASAEGMEPMERLQYASHVVATELAQEVGSMVAATTGLLGAPMGAMTGPLWGGSVASLARTRLGSLALGGIGETLQEGAQSAAESLLGNMAFQQINPDQEITEGLLEDVTSGMAAGSAMGAVFGFSSPETDIEGEHAQREENQEQDFVLQAAARAVDAGADRDGAEAIARRALTPDEDGNLDLQPEEAVKILRALEIESRLRSEAQRKQAAAKESAAQKEAEQPAESVSETSEDSTPAELGEQPDDQDDGEPPPPGGGGLGGDFQARLEKAEAGLQSGEFEDMENVASSASTAEEIGAVRKALEEAGYDPDDGWGLSEAPTEAQETVGADQQGQSFEDKLAEAMEPLKSDDAIGDIDFTKIDKLAAEAKTPEERRAIEEALEAESYDPADWTDVFSIEPPSNEEVAEQAAAQQKARNREQLEQNYQKAREQAELIKAHLSLGNDPLGVGEDVMKRDLGINEGEADQIHQQMVILEGQEAADKWREDQEALLSETIDIAMNSTAREEGAADADLAGQEQAAEETDGILSKLAQQMEPESNTEASQETPEPVAEPESQPEEASQEASTEGPVDEEFFAQVKAAIKANDVAAMDALYERYKEDEEALENEGFWDLLMLRRDAHQANEDNKAAGPSAGYGAKGIPKKYLTGEPTQELYNALEAYTGDKEEAAWRYGDSPSVDTNTEEARESEIAALNSLLEAISLQLDLENEIEENGQRAAFDEAIARQQQKAKAEKAAAKKAEKEVAEKPRKDYEAAEQKAQELSREVLEVEEVVARREANGEDAAEYKEELAELQADLAAARSEANRLYEETGGDPEERYGFQQDTEEAPADTDDVLTPAEMKKARDSVEKAVAELAAMDDSAPDNQDNSDYMNERIHLFRMIANAIRKAGKLRPMNWLVDAQAEQQKNDLFMSARTQERLQELFDDADKPVYKPAMLGQGDKATTTSGRLTSAFPKIDMNSSQKITNSLKRVEKWLQKEAIAEAKARDDDMNLAGFESENGRLPQATKDAMNLYLFGHELGPEESAVTRSGKDDFANRAGLHSKRAPLQARGAPETSIPLNANQIEAVEWALGTMEEFWDPDKGAEAEGVEANDLEPPDSWTLPRVENGRLILSDWNEVNEDMAYRIRENLVDMAEENTVDGPLDERHRKAGYISRQKMTALEKAYTQLADKITAAMRTPLQAAAAPDPAILKEMNEHRGRLFGGAYGWGELVRAAKDAPKRKMIALARTRYNELRQQVGLEPITDWKQKIPNDHPVAPRAPLQARRVDMPFNEVTKRVKPVQDAVGRLERGEITQEQYDNIVNRAKPFEPYEKVPDMASDQEIAEALDKNKVPHINKPHDLPAGEAVSLRLDIPAYSRHGRWVVTVHKKSGGSTAGKRIGYTAYGSVTGAAFAAPEQGALKIAKGAAKGPIARIEGAWQPMSRLQARQRAEQAMKDPDWIQVGYDPERHSFFWNRENGRPVVSAEEVIQIAGLVLVKNPVYGSRRAALFQQGAAEQEGSGQEQQPPKRKGLTVEQVMKFTARLRAVMGNLVTFKIVQSPDDLPASARWDPVNRVFMDVSRTEGLWLPGTRTVYLIADNLRDQDHAVQIALHEVFGHLGLESQPEFKDLFDMVRNLYNTKNKRIMALAAIVMERQGKRPGEVGGIEAGSDTHILEIIALAVELGIDKRLINKVRAAVRAFLRRLGIMQGFSDKEVDQLILTGMRKYEQRAQAVNSLLAGAGVASVLNDPDASLQALSDALDRITDYQMGRLDHINNLQDQIDSIKQDPRYQDGMPDDAARELADLEAELDRVALHAKAYHAGPHQFDRFNMDAVGTGEGVQAYGHGLYFSMVPGVAKRFLPRDLDIEKRYFDKNQAAAFNENYLEAEMWERAMMHESPDELEEIYADSSDEYREAAEKVANEMRAMGRKGALYEVEISDEAIAKMLDWDAPLGDQPEIKAALQRAAVKIGRPDMAKTLQDKETGGAAYVYLTGAIGDSQLADKGYPSGQPGQKRVISEALNEEGVPGITYVDSETMASGEAATNIVLFDADLAKVKTRNGEPVRTPLQAKTFHGSYIHDLITKGVDLTFVGTGQGAQMLGWGFYTSSHSPIANHHRPRGDGIDNNVIEINGGRWLASDLLDYVSRERQAASDRVRELSEDAEEIAEELRLKIYYENPVGQAALKKRLADINAEIDIERENSRMAVPELDALYSAARGGSVEYGIESWQAKLDELSDIDREAGEIGLLALVAKVQGYRREKLKKGIAFLKGLEGKVQIIKNAGRPGSLVEVEVPDDSEMLHWDLPLDQQPDSVLEAIQKIPAEIWKAIDEGLENSFMNTMSDALDSYLGHHFYRALENDYVHEALPDRVELSGVVSDWTAGTRTDKHVSLWLGTIGIPGIKARAERLSREGSPHSNYVTWDQSRINVTNEISSRQDIGEVNKPEALLRTPLQARAWHGSTMTGIERLMLKYIGNGTGIQAAGWGLYATDSKEYADETYRGRAMGRGTAFWDQYRIKIKYRGREYSSDQLTRMIGKANNRGDDTSAQVYGVLRSLGHQMSVDPENETRVRERIMEQYGITKEGAEQTRKILQDTKVVIPARPIKPGSLLELDVPEEHELLNWDAPLGSQAGKKMQSAAIRANLEKLRNWLDALGHLETLERAVGKDFWNMSGELLYRGMAGLAMEKRLQRPGSGMDSAIWNVIGRYVKDKNYGAAVFFAQKTVSLTLLDFGIPGHFGQGNAAAPNARVYVIWDEDLIKVTGREEGELDERTPAFAKVAPIGARHISAEERGIMDAALDDPLSMLRLQEFIEDPMNSDKLDTFVRRLTEIGSAYGDPADYDDEPKNPQAAAVRSIMMAAESVMFERYGMGKPNLKTAEAAMKEIARELTSKEFAEKNRRPMHSVFHRQRALGDAQSEAIIDRWMDKPREDYTLMDRLRALVAKVLQIDKVAVKQAILDSAASLAELEREVYGEILDASVSPYKAVLATRNISSVMTGVMLAGVPVYLDGSFQAKKGRKGIIEIFRPLTTHEEGNLMHLWEAYAVALRGRELLAQGKEFMKYDGQLADIEKIIKAGQKYKTADGKILFDEVHKQWLKFNNEVLDLAVSAGVLNSSERELWRNNSYVPFYRSVEEFEFPELYQSVTGRKPTGKGGGVADAASRIYKYKGSERRFGHVFENMIMNTTYLIDASFRNVAMQRIAEAYEDVALFRVPKRTEAIKIGEDQLDRALEKMGYTREEIEDMEEDERESYALFFRKVAPEGPDIVSVLVGGDRQYFRVEDPLLLRTLQGIGTQRADNVMSLFRGAKTTLTTFVTADPAFMLANFMRDTMAAFVQSEAGLVPTDSIKGLKKAWDEDEDMISLMLAGAGGGGFYDTNPEDVRELLTHRLPKGQVDTFMNSVVSPKGWWRFWRRVGNASEQANRVATFKRVRDAGGSVAEAAYQARDVLNFTMSGDHRVIQFLIGSVPFMNARIQGLYRMGRAYENNRKAFLTKGLSLMMVTLALLWRNWDNEDYELLPEWDKDLYWHIWIGRDQENGVKGEHFRIPKPFEHGAIFATIPERIWRKASGRDPWNVVKERGLAMLMDTMAFNPVPQLAKPVAELWANKDFFRKQPIVGIAQQGRVPEDQYSPWTSETARVMGKELPDWLPDAMRSPQRLEHLVRAYFGTTGSYLLSMSDVAARGVFGLEDRPTKDIRDYPVIKRFWRNPDPRSTKYSSQLYNMTEEANSIYRSLNARKSAGLIDGARELLGENQSKLMVRKQLNDLVSEVRKVNGEIKKVYASALTDDEKQRRLIVLTNRRNEIMSRVAPLSEHF